MSREQVPAAGWMRPTVIAAGHRHGLGETPVVINEVAA
jgi:hypothetical protein